MDGPDAPEAAGNGDVTDPNVVSPARSQGAEGVNEGGPVGLRRFYYY